MAELDNCSYKFILLASELALNGPPLKSRKLMVSNGSSTVTTEGQVPRLTSG